MPELLLASPVQYGNQNAERRWLQSGDIWKIRIPARHGYQKGGERERQIACGSDAVFIAVVQHGRAHQRANAIGNFLGRCNYIKDNPSSCPAVCIGSWSPITPFLPYRWKLMRMLSSSSDRLRETLVLDFIDDFIDPGDHDRVARSCDGQTAEAHPCAPSSFRAYGVSSCLNR